VGRRHHGERQVGDEGRLVLRESTIAGAHSIWWNKLQMKWVSWSEAKGGHRSERLQSMRAQAARRE
jgi:hypothetical protein